MFQKPNGDPQVTGWTGYDCSTPICVQAETFRLNVDTSSSIESAIVSLGGHGKAGDLECPNERCPEYDRKCYLKKVKSALLSWFKLSVSCLRYTYHNFFGLTSPPGMVTSNDGTSWQVGCGWDVLETGCCFELEDAIAAYVCLRCEELLVSAHNATCARGALKKWEFSSLSKVPLTFRTLDGVLKCGPSLNPPIAATNSSYGNTVSTTSNLFLCNVWQWEQGSFSEADTGLEPRRHIRVNNPNPYQRNKTDPNKWIAVQEIQGESSVVLSPYLHCQYISSILLIYNVVQKVRACLSASTEVVVFLLTNVHAEMALAALTALYLFADTNKLQGISWDAKMEVSA